MNITRLQQLLLTRDPALLVDRVHPRFGIHSQANHRWSTTDPPLAQYPEDLEAMLDLDPDTGELGYDYDQQERRIVAAISQDVPMLEALSRGHDCHTLDTCDVFGYEYPPDPMDPHAHPANDPWRAAIGWKGKKDKRRVMGKNFFFSLCFGKDPKNMLDIPGAKALGMNKARFEQAANRFLAKHPGIRKWMAGIKTRCKVRPVSRTFLGTRRYSHLKDAELYRAMLDHPIQAAAADMVNTVIVETVRSVPYVQLRWTKHDFVSWGVEGAAWNNTTIKDVLSIAEQEWDADGVRFRVPVTAYTRWAGEEKKPWSAL